MRFPPKISFQAGFFFIGTTDLHRYDGLPREWIGVPPDIRVKQTEEDILNGRDKQLEFAISMLK